MPFISSRNIAVLPFLTGNNPTLTLEHDEDQLLAVLDSAFGNLLPNVDLGVDSTKYMRGF